MTAEFLAVAAGFVISAGLALIPGLKTWFEALTAQYKQLLNVGVTIVVAFAIWGLGCAGWAAGLGLPSLACTQTGLQSLLVVLFYALAANLTTYGSTKYITESKTSRSEREAGLR